MEQGWIGRVGMEDLINCAAAVDCAAAVKLVPLLDTSCMIIENPEPSFFCGTAASLRCLDRASNTRLKKRGRPGSIHADWLFFHLRHFKHEEMTASSAFSPPVSNI